MWVSRHFMVTLSIVIINNNNLTNSIIGKDGGSSDGHIRTVRVCVGGWMAGTMPHKVKSLFPYQRVHRIHCSFPMNLSTTCYTANSFIRRFVSCE